MNYLCIEMYLLNKRKKLRLSVHFFGEISAQLNLFLKFIINKIFFYTLRILKNINNMDVSIYLFCIRI
jgi:hypothetical protein